MLLLCPFAITTFFGEEGCEFGWLITGFMGIERLEFGIVFESEISDCGETGGVKYLVEVEFSHTLFC